MFFEVFPDIFDPVAEKIFYQGEEEDHKENDEHDSDNQALIIAPCAHEIADELEKDSHGGAEGRARIEEGRASHMGIER